MKHLRIATTITLTRTAIEAATLDLRAASDTEAERQLHRHITLTGHTPVHAVPIKAVRHTWWCAECRTYTEAPIEHGLRGPWEYEVRTYTLTANPTGDGTI